MAEDKIQSAEEQLRFGDDTSTTADDGQAISTSVVEKLVVQSVTLSDAAKDIVPSPDEKLGIGNNTSTDTKDVQVTSISGEEKLEVCKQTSPATEDSKVNWMLFEQKLNAHDDTSSDPQEVQVPSTSEATQQFGDETLRAMAKVYLEDGNKEYRKKEVHSAIHFYTNGLLVNCNDDRLNAKLCSNRAAVNFYLGNYKETLVDATVSVHLEPSLIKAIVKGARACVRLQLYEEAKTWWQKGLQIDYNNKQLLDLWTKSVGELNDAVQETNQKEDMSSHISPSEKSQDIRNVSYIDEICPDDTQEVISLKQDLQIAKAAKDKYGEGAAYNNLGFVYHCLEEFRKAIEFYKRSLNLFKETGSRVSEGENYCNLGNAYQELGNFIKAIEYQQLALEIRKEVGDKDGEGVSYCNLGAAYNGLGNFLKAIEYQQLALEIFKEVGDKTGEGYSYCNLGAAYDGLANFLKAIEYQQLALEIFKEVGDKAKEGESYQNLSIEYYKLGNFLKAIEYKEHAPEIYKEMGNKAMEGKSYCNLSNAYNGLGNFLKAIEYQELALEIFKEMGDKAREGVSYYNLGNEHIGLGNFLKAIEYQQLALEIFKEVGNKTGEGRSYCNLGAAYNGLGDFLKAIEYQQLALEIFKEVGNKAGEGKSYCNLGYAYKEIGNFRKAIEYQQLALIINKQVGNKAGEGCNYSNLGTAYRGLKIFRKTIEYHQLALEIFKEVGDKAREGNSYCNLGDAYQQLGNFLKAIEYQQLALEIFKEVGDKVGEGGTYCNLGAAYDGLGNFRKAIEYQQLALEIFKEVGDKAKEAHTLFNLGLVSKSLEPLSSLKYYRSSVTIYNELRASLRFKEEWKITYRSSREYAYTALWKLHLDLVQVVEALLVADQARAQALNDMVNYEYGSGEPCYLPHLPDKPVCELPVGCAQSNLVFLKVTDIKMYFWVVQIGNHVQFRKIKIGDYGSGPYLTENFIAKLNNEKFGTLRIKCENRSLDDEPCDDELAPERAVDKLSESSQTESLHKLYDIIIGPIADLINGHELIFVPERSLCMVPFAALMDSNSKYLCESFRIRVIPSLTTLKLIVDAKDDFHNKTGALLLGNPCLDEVLFEGRKLDPLPCAEREVKMIGDILDSTPLIGEEATKDEVLRRLSSVALVHIAAHGRMETGEIILAPRTNRKSQTPAKEDYLLTMKDVSDVHMRARLVVLSCCHSARGEIKAAEGVIGIARSFLGAGARSVLVALWALGDEATMEFMKYFYKELAAGKRASEALQQAMNCMREIEQFRNLRNWAPFVLIGDDVTLDLPDASEV